MLHPQRRGKSLLKWLKNSRGSFGSATATFIPRLFFARTSSRRLIESTVWYRLVSFFIQLYFRSTKSNADVSIDGGRKLVIGTDNGIYLAERWPKDKSAKPRRILDATAVTQIDTLEEYQLVLVLANKTLFSYPMEALDVNEGQNPLARRPKKIQGHQNFFKVGIGLGRHLVCSVKTSALSTTIKVFEPMENLTRGGKKPALGKMFRGSQEALKPFKVSSLEDVTIGVHTNYLRRNITSQPNLLLYTSYDQLCALVVPEVLKLSVSKRQKASHSSTRPTLPWTLLREKRTSSLFILNE